MADTKAPRPAPPLGVSRVLRPFHEHSLTWEPVIGWMAEYTSCSECEKKGLTQQYKCNNMSCSKGVCLECVAVVAADVDAEATVRLGPDSLAASAAGDVARLRALLAAGAKTDEVDGNKRTALHLAAEAGSAACVQALLDAGADANARDEREYTPLHKAAEEAGPTAAAAVCRALLAKGADVDAVQCGAQTALYVAASKKKAEMAAVLMAAKANVNLKDNDGCTALNVASEDLAMALLEAGADTTGVRGYYEHTLMHDAASGNKPRVVKALLAKGAAADTKTSNGYTPLAFAARENAGTEAAQLLLDAGADVEARDSSDLWWPLMLAANAATGAAHIELLLSRGAKLDGGYGGDGGNFTVLQAAVCCGHADNAAVLLKAGADRDAKTKDGKSLEELVAALGEEQAVAMRAALDGTLPALRAAEAAKEAEAAAAAAKDPVAVAQKLLDAVSDGDLQPLEAALKAKTLDPNMRMGPASDPTCETVVATCIRMANDVPHFVAALRLMLAHGADPELRFDGPMTDTNNVTPLLFAVKTRLPSQWSWAKGSEGADMVAMLLDKGADTEAKDGSGQTALALLSAMHPCPAVIDAMRALLDKGADVQAKAEDGMSVVDGAWGDMRRLLVELNKIKV